MHLETLYGEKDQVNASGSDTDLILYFPYHKRAIKWVKSIEGAQYQGYDKSWALPVDDSNQGELIQLIQSLRSLFREEAERARFKEELQLDMATPLLDALQADFDHPQIHMSVREGHIELSCPYQPKAIKVLKKIPGKQWVPSEKVWLLPADQESKIRKALLVIMKEL